MQTLGNKAQDTSGPAIQRDSLRACRVRVLVEIPVEAFAELQSNSPQARLYRGTAQVHRYCRLLYGQPFNVSQHKNRPRDRTQLFQGTSQDFA
jgi:hypothetical protein